MTTYDIHVAIPTPVLLTAKVLALPSKLRKPTAQHGAQSQHCCVCAAVFLPRTTLAAAEHRRGSASLADQKNRRLWAGCEIRWMSASVNVDAHCMWLWSSCESSGFFGFFCVGQN